MNTTERLERELTLWLDEAATPRTPDWIDDLLARTAGTRQRSEWTFFERWLPMSAITLGRQTVRPLPWRTIVLVALLSLVAVGAAVFVASRPRVPPPFGAAGNGLVASVLNGDIHVVDRVSGARRAIVTGPDLDHDPRWSRDGTRLAFLRGDGTFDLPVIAAAGGTIQVLPPVAPFRSVDPDALSWSPDGRTFAFAATVAPRRQAIHLLDTASGAVTVLPVDYAFMEFYWRPPDGRELLFLGGTEPNLGLYLYSIRDGTVRELPLSRGDRASLRTVGWTPDGKRFAFHRLDTAADRSRTHIVDVETGAEVVVDAGFARLSNDGNRLVGYDGDGDSSWLCVANTSGGPCERLDGTSFLPEAMHGEAVQWSPDDAWIVTQSIGGTRSFLLDPDFGIEQPFGQRSAIESWQRVLR